MSNSPQSWLSINLKTSLLVGGASLSAVGTASGVFFDSNQGVLKAVQDSAQPILDPFQKGYLLLSSELNNLSNKGYNAGVDIKSWVTENLNKAKIKGGGLKIYDHLKQWYEAGRTFAAGAKDTISNFFVNWESNREVMHEIFKALGNAFPIIGSILGGSMTGDGESTLKILFEAINEPKFKDFMSEVSKMASNNPSLLSELKMDDYTDVIFAFKQDPETVTSTLKTLNDSQEKEKINKDKLMNSLKLYSLQGKAKSLLDRAKLMVSTQNKEKIPEIIKEIEEITKQLESVIQANSVT